MDHIEYIQEQQFAEWDGYVKNIDGTSITHRSSWLTSISKTYQLPVFFTTYYEKDKIRGILPLVLINSPISGKSLVSVPFMTSGGIYADTPSIEAELINSAEDLAHKLHVHSIELRQAKSLGCENISSYHLNENYCTYILPLHEDIDVIWKQFNKKVRNQIRNSEKQGFTFSRGLEHFEAFYRVFAERMRDLGTPVHSRNWFYQLVRNYPNDYEVFVILDGDITIGGMFALRHNHTIYPLAACSLKSYFRYSPNNFLYWHTIKYACEHGYKTFDFGRSTEGSGTAHFKSQWGAIKEPIFYYSYNINNPDKQLSPEPGAAARLFIRCWQLMPVFLTRILGPWFRKRIP